MTRPRVSAVSFLNTTPLVWGLLHGPQKDLAELSFEVPSACAESVASGAADIGIIPVIEMDRQKLPFVPGLGIASFGAVRSIFVVSKVPAPEIRTIAMDTSSRTSVALARIVLQTKYAARPAAIPHAPDVSAMLQAADAALVIGDPALRLEPEQNGLHVYDLGSEWTDITGLPMVYAVWAGRRAAELADLLNGSYEFGRTRLEEIVALEAAPRGISPQLAASYLSRNIIFELSDLFERGLARYLELARQL